MPWIVPPSPPANELFGGDERAMLEGFLDWHRAALLDRCAGLTGEQLALRAVPPSNLSLLGLVRHLTEVERTWFRRRFAEEVIAPPYARPDDPDAAFNDLDPARAEAAVAALVAELDACRRAVAALPLDTVYRGERWGPMILRWAYLHMIREYALHQGHADLLRERIDGVTG